MLYDLLTENNYRPSALTKTVVGHFEMMVSINGTDTNFIVDTGAAKTVVDLSFARSQQLVLQESTIQVCGLGSNRLVLYRIKSATLMVGEFRLFLPEIHAIDLRHIRQSLLEKGVSRPANGIIGADVLNHHKAIIDYANQLLYLQKQAVVTMVD
jgi:hypothetical protein